MNRHPSNPKSSPDLKGTTSGSLEVLRRAEKRGVGNKILWECLCHYVRDGKECGKVVFLATDKLSRYNVKRQQSCGCMPKDPKFKNRVIRVAPQRRPNDE